MIPRYTTVSVELSKLHALHFFDILFQIEYMYSLTFMAFGAGLFVPFVKYKMKLPYIGEIHAPRIVIHMKVYRKMPLIF